MRIKITYETLDGDIVLPKHYNHHIQALIYKTFSPQLATNLHNIGFPYGKRRFKLFTFSRILEKGIPTKDDTKLIFKRKITFYFSSPIEDIVENLAERSFKEREFELCGKKIYISQLQIITTPKIEEKVKIKAISPITIYSTLKKADGSKIVHFYKPIDKEFSKLIENNAKKKFHLIYGKDPEELKLEIKPLKFSVKDNLKLVKFKDTIIEGYTGVYELTGSPELIYVTYEAGLGNKNSGGFGMWEICREKEEDENA